MTDESEHLESAKLWYESARNLGCCNYCSLRFSGDTSCKSFIGIGETLVSKGFETEVQAPSKVLKENPCVACLGILHTPCIEELVEKLSAGIGTTRAVNVLISLPFACHVRALSLWLALSSKFPDYATLFPLGKVTVSVKDVVRWLVGARLGVSVTGTAGLTAQADFIYQQDLIESRQVRPLFNGSMPSRKALEELENCASRQELQEVLTEPPSIPDYPLKLKSISFTHPTIYVAGRYRKTSRNLSQTPWIVEGERKMDSSVQEYIAGPIQAAFNSQGSKFMSSGREDVDVRMLGRGRPFVVEVTNPGRPSVDLGDVQRDINLAAGGLISVIHLQTVNKRSLSQLKAGEETKEKVYRALCRVDGEWKEPKISGRLVLSQATPVRVLHRRPQSVRSRYILDLRITPVTCKQPGNYIVMEVRTQAGTYVKEFVHGDLGRTKPSLSTLLGAPCDILALDVMEIAVDWPPPVEHKVKPVVKDKNGVTQNDKLFNKTDITITCQS